MEKYNYQDAVKTDIIEFIKSEYTTREIRTKLHDDRDGWYDELNDRLWTEDSVTGNASGSYTISTWKAEENLCHNLDLLGEALSEFGCSPAYMQEHGAEACDVTIRCYLLGSGISEALDELDDDLSTGLSLDDLTDDELHELRERLLTEKLDEVGQTPSLDDLLTADDLITEQELHDRFDGTTFVKEDFFCNI